MVHQWTRLLCVQHHRVVYPKPMLLPHLHSSSSKVLQTLVLFLRRHLKHHLTLILMLTLIHTRIRTRICINTPRNLILIHTRILMFRFILSRLHRYTTLNLIILSLMIQLVAPSVKSKNTRLKMSKPGGSVMDGPLPTILQAVPCGNDRRMEIWSI